MIPAGLRAQARAWMSADPDPADRAELAALLSAGEQAGEAGRAAAADLAGRFAGRLTFGTAGLRGPVGAGPARMNRAVVRAATVALAGWLREHRPGAAAGGVVIGCDARHRSAQFADEAAAVLTGAGIRVHLLPRPGPTPLLAFAVRHLSAAAGIMITASHNPPADNGYKLYLGDGAQIVPPADEQIEAAMAGLVPLAAARPAARPPGRAQVPAPVPGGTVPPAPGALLHRCGDEVARAYLDAVAAACPPPAPGPPPARGPAPAPPRVVYTPLHGVAGGLALRAMERAGFPAPVVVAAQAEPDPDFPTVAHPNPEEPGALDLALDTARTVGADIVLANDPDGDRLAVAVPDPDAGGGWRVLTGDQVGALLGAYLLERSAGDPGPGERLVVTTVVSSTMLARIAAGAGARCVRTLTGFKWIVRAGEELPGSRFVFGYEEALGYAVTTAVRDKDGISAALAVLSLLVSTRNAGWSLLQRWDALEAAHGVHLTGRLTLATPSPARVMARLRAGPPAALAGQPVTGITDLRDADARVDGRPLPAADVLIYQLPGGRVVIRPSGTEPLLKAYLEIVERVPGRTLAQARAAAAGRLAPLRTAVAALVDGPGPA